MSVLNAILKVAGKENFEFDPAIPTSYIFRQCWKYGWMMFRGMFYSLVYKNISRSIFVGKKIKMISKKNISIGSKTKIQDGVYIDALSRKGVKIGENVVIGRNSRIECTGSLQSVGKGVIIGDRTTFGNDCIFGAAGGIEIGDDVVAGQLIRFHSENHNFTDVSKLIRDQGVTHKGIKIGNNCRIGSGSVFLDGSQLGNGCVVAANAVVTKKFPDNVVIAGVPAKIIKVRTELNDL